MAHEQQPDQPHENAEGAPLTPEEVSWVRRLLARYREALEKEVEAELPGIQERVARRGLEGERRGPDDPGGGRGA